MKVYPNPVELVMMFQKSIPTEVFEIVMSMLAVEVNVYT